MKTLSTLKRVGFKRKATKPLKRTVLKKASKQPISKLKKKLWTVFSEYIRKRDKGICFTCGRKCEGKGYHAGHFIPKSVGGIVLYFHPENVRGQCYNCNINLGGSQYEYSQKLGDETVKRLYKLKGIIQKWDAERYEWEINYYKTLIEELQ